MNCTEFDDLLGEYRKNIEACARKGSTKSCEFDCDRVYVELCWAFLHAKLEKPKKS